MNERREVTCELCSLTFQPMWSEEECLNEKKENFGDMPISNMSVVCTDCFNKIMRYAVNEGLHKKKWREVTDG